MKLIAGNCVFEDFYILSETAHFLTELCDKLNIDLLFKCSYDKANRTSASSYRGKGAIEFQKALHNLRLQLPNLKVITDVHSEHMDFEIELSLLDAIQIPAFLCRQSSLLEAAGRTGLPVYIKKGQFCSPYIMGEAKKKVGHDQVFFIERGSFFGYSDVVVDFRNLAIMKQFGPVLFDMTHSCQVPGGLTTKGNRDFVLGLARAALTYNLEGLFCEVHPNPAEALSDKETQLSFKEAEDMITELKAFEELEENLTQLKLKYKDFNETNNLHTK